MSRLSSLAESLIGSEIVKLGNEISNRVRNGEHIYNYTIGDFAPSLFPIPKELEEEIINAYRAGYTNYPSADGILELRKAVSHFLQSHINVAYDPAEIQIASGGRPLIYSIFATIVDRGDKVVYAVPSWNNNHYAYLNGAIPCEIQTTPENHFMPRAEDLVPYIQEAALICLCTPQNPTGTVLSKEELEKICDLVIEENKRRGADEKKLYVLFDQMYHTLTYGDTKHYHPVLLRPEMKDYTITVDGISKSFAATGVRVGWAMGPARVITKMKALISHIGAWAPMAEQKATAAFLVNDTATRAYLTTIKEKLESRLWKIYDGFEALKNKGFAVSAIAPQAAIYLTVKLDLKGKKHGAEVLAAQDEVTQYILAQAGLAIVPFYCFGADRESPWYRISVGTCKTEDIEAVFRKLEAALSNLQ